MPIIYKINTLKSIFRVKDKTDRKDFLNLYKILLERQKEIWHDNRFYFKSVLTYYLKNQWKQKK